jgi:drug/metabolite transporter (DMT)-like permease
MLKWTGTILCLIGIALTSLNEFPSNIWFGFIGSALWAWSGIRDKDYALFVVEFVAVMMYLGGIIKYAYSS